MQKFPLFDPIEAQAPKAGKPRGRASKAVILLVLGMLAPGLSGCRKEPPEQALRDTIAAMETAAERHDTDALFEPIAEDFAGSEGMDRQAFRRYVTFMGMRSKSVGVQLGPLDVKLYDQRATVSFTAALSAGEGLLPDRVQVYDVDTGWRLDNGQWQLISAKWKPQL